MLLMEEVQDELLCLIQSLLCGMFIISAIDINRIHNKDFRFRLLAGSSLLNTAV